MDLWTLKITDFQKICRVCLEECPNMNNIYEIHNVHEMSIVNLIDTCMFMKIEEHAELPNLICAQCEEQVLNIYNFKLKLEKAKTYFDEYLAQFENECVKKEQINIIDIIDEDKVEIENDYVKQEQINTVVDDKFDSNDDSVIIEYHVGIPNGTEIPVDVDVIKIIEESSDVEIQKEGRIIKTVKNKASNKRHNYACNKCNEIFDSKIQLTNHRRKLQHYTRKSVTCPQCKLHVPVQNYKSHFLKHSAKFRCEACLKDFSNNFNLQRHLYIHTKQTPYVCDLCGARFARQDKLKAHVMIHTCEKPFACVACGQLFRMKEQLKQHQEKCSSTDGSSAKYKRSLSCDVCFKSFGLLSSLRIHKLLHTDERVICSVCGKPYPNEKKLKEHKLKVHSGKESHSKEFLCNICAKQYSNKAVLQRHLLSHMGLAKTYNCDICNKSFTQSGSLALHMKIHTGEKPFVCHVCSRAFNKPSNLQRHLRSHDNVRPYCCAICEKTFSVKHSLTVHTRIHTGEKPYECPVCGKKFVDRGSMSKHVKIHNGPR